MLRQVWQNIKATNKSIKSHSLLSSCLQSVSIYLFTKSYFLQLILPLLSYNSWIQCLYHVHLECQARCYKSRSETTAFDQSYFRGWLNTNTVIIRINTTAFIKFLALRVRHLVEGGVYCKFCNNNCEFIVSLKLSLNHNFNTQIALDLMLSYFFFF